MKKSRSVDEIMQKKRYQWIWWLLALMVLAGILWLFSVRQTGPDYADGTLVMYMDESVPETGGGA